MSSLRSRISSVSNIKRRVGRSIVFCATLTLALFLIVPPTPAYAQNSGAASQKFGGPNVGDMAPDFTINGVTRYGALRDPIKLSDLRGQTVVLAFFPGARTPGCTIQMEKYRDTYATTFNNGNNVVVIGISIDADTTLAAWARDAHFPMLFTSDANGSIGSLYGAYDTKYKVDHRLLYVIAPDGKVSYVAKPFNVSKSESYTELSEAVKKAVAQSAN
jgi:peroxiredoxin